MAGHARFVLGSLGKWFTKGEATGRVEGEKTGGGRAREGGEGREGAGRGRGERKGMTHSAAEFSLPSSSSLAQLPSPPSSPLPPASPLFRLLHFTLISLLFFHLVHFFPLSHSAFITSSFPPLGRRCVLPILPSRVN